MPYHTPVLLSETLDLLAIEPGMILVDGTLGNGGHTIEFLKLGAKVFGVDQDPQNLELTTNRIKDLGLSANFQPIHSNFAKLDQIVETIGCPIDRLFLDLGLSQNQLKSANRGFSFNDSQSLDMRLDPEIQELTAENIINTYSFEDLFEIFTKYAQERYAKPIILRLIRQRQQSPIKDAHRLAEIINGYYETNNIHSNIHPATKVLMALRIAVNDEFPNLKQVLNLSLTTVKKNGRVALITFHSGEDRIVKQFIHKQEMAKTIVPLTKKAILPSRAEIKLNPLSRSSLLRSYRIY